MRTIGHYIDGKAVAGVSGRLGDISLAMTMAAAVDRNGGFICSSFQSWPM